MSNNPQEATSRQDAVQSPRDLYDALVKYYMLAEQFDRMIVPGGIPMTSSQYGSMYRYARNLWTDLIAQPLSSIHSNMKHAADIEADKNIDAGMRIQDDRPKIRLNPRALL